ncbi:MAG: RHS repeat protein [Polyangiaceae bacterium]|nr:RHS repeat protein [Polyangiaceae bacterium]
MGAPVLIGGPEAVDFAAAATQAIRTKWVSGKLHALTGAAKGSKRSKVICFLTGHPVDVMTGELLAEETDAELPGTIPVVFERNYRSRESEAQSVGPGWYHFFDAYIEPCPGRIMFRHPDGRPAEHPAIEVGETYFHPPDRYSIARDTDGYRLLLPEGIIYHFKATEPARYGIPVRHRIVEIRDRGRNVIALDWRGGYLAAIRDTAGRNIVCRYTREGQLERLLLVEDGEEFLLVEYRYEDGFLGAAVNPLGHAIRYAYRGGVLVREVQRDGLTFHFEWDWDHPEGWCVRTWGDAGNGDPAVMDLAPGATPPRAIYDRRLTFDKLRHRTMVHDLRGGITLYEGNGLELVDKIVDATGRVTKFEWNPHAWKTAEEDGLEQRFEWKYDDRGNRIAEKDPLGNETRWGYDPLDRLVEIGEPNGAVYRIEYDRSDKPRSIQRPDGTAMVYTNDVFGRLVGIDDPMGRRFRFEWSDRHDLLSVADGENRTTSYVTDRFGRVTAAKDPLAREMRADRDAAGNIVFIEQFDSEQLALRYDPAGRVIEQIDGRGRRVKLRYAGMGRLVEHTDAMGYRIRLRYDAEEDLVAVENQAGDVYAFDLDRAGRVLRETSFAGHRRQYTYDKAGLRDRVVSGQGRVTKITRDALGRVVETLCKGGEHRALSSPEIESFAYDELGQMVAARASGADVVLERDPLGQITREHQKIRASGHEAALTSRYDLSGLRVKRSTTLAHETSYEHNRVGDLISVRADWALGRGRAALQKLGLPQATVGAFEVRFARDALGQEIARRLPGGVSAVWSRDRLGRPVEQRVVTGAAADRRGTEIIRKGYAWQSPDQIASVTDIDPTNGRMRSGSAFEYDPRGHLVREILSTGGVLERQSDAIGNLFRTGDKTDRIYGKGGVLRRAGGTDYSYDADGYLIQRTLSDGATWIYSWSAQGHLKEVTRPDKRKVTFDYDGLGRRVRKAFDGRITEYVWDGDELVHERTQDATGKEQPLVTWVFEPGTFSPIAKFEGRKRFGVVSDQLGVPSALVTETGTLAWRAQLDVYGVPHEEVGVSEAADRTENPWRFPGQYADPETGLYYNRFRYYDPDAGRYISEDPLGLRAGDTNPFSYPDDPWGYWDPYGLVEGGSYSKTRRTNKGGEVHHTPAQSTYSDVKGAPSYGRGPAVHMSIADHAKTASHGSQGRAGQIYRQQQEALIRKGKWADAIAMDVKDVSKKFPGKYKNGLKEMIDHARAQDLITDAQQKKLKGMCK